MTYELNNLSKKEPTTPGNSDPSLTDLEQEEDVELQKRLEKRMLDIFPSSIKEVLSAYFEGNLSTSSWNVDRENNVLSTNQYRMGGIYMSDSLPGYVELSQQTKENIKEALLLGLIDAIENSIVMPRDMGSQTHLVFLNFDEREAMLRQISHYLSESAAQVISNILQTDPSTVQVKDYICISIGSDSVDEPCQFSLIVDQNNPTLRLAQQPLTDPQTIAGALMAKGAKQIYDKIDDKNTLPLITLDGSIQIKVKNGTYLTSLCRKDMYSDLQSVPIETKTTHSSNHEKLKYVELCSFFSVNDLVGKFTKEQKIKFLAGEKIDLELDGLEITGELNLESKINLKQRSVHLVDLRGMSALASIVAAEKEAGAPAEYVLELRKGFSSVMKRWQEVYSQILCTEGYNTNAYGGDGWDSISDRILSSYSLEEIQTLLLKLVDLSSSFDTVWADALADKIDVPARKLIEKCSSEWSPQERPYVKVSAGVLDAKLTIHPGKTIMVQWSSKTENIQEGLDAVKSFLVDQHDIYDNVIAINPQLADNILKTVPARFLLENQLSIVESKKDENNKSFFLVRRKTKRDASDLI